MRSSWGIWIGGTLVALNALVVGQDLTAYHDAATSVPHPFPVWPIATLVIAIGYTALATTLFIRARFR